MFAARVTLAAAGLKRGVVSGDTVLTFDAATRFNFRPVRVQFETPLGRPLALLTASGGTVNMRMLLDTPGAVVITSDTARRRIEARAVQYDPFNNELVSDSPFVAIAGIRRLNGVGFVADPGLFRVRCRQQCTGSLGPCP
jgi:hypothetical protein